MPSSFRNYVVIGLIRTGASNLNRVISIQRDSVRTASRAGRCLLDVERRATKISHRRRLIDIVHRPLLASRHNLLHVADASSALGLVAVLHEVRDRNSGQNGDDGDHDHDFNEGKTLQYVFHGCVPFFVLFICVDTMPTQNLICKLHAKIYYV